jgi:hypothetical protein
MIDSTSSPDRASRVNAYLGDLHQTAARQGRIETDRLSTDQAEQLQQALAQYPEVRPEMVARGQALAADPNYPPPEVIAHVAEQIVNAPDLSEDPS